MHECTYYVFKAIITNNDDDKCNNRNNYFFIESYLKLIINIKKITTTTSHKLIGISLFIYIYTRKVKLNETCKALLCCSIPLCYQISYGFGLNCKK